MTTDKTPPLEPEVSSLLPVGMRLLTGRLLIAVGLLYGSGMLILGHNLIHTHTGIEGKEPHTGTIEQSAPSSAPFVMDRTELIALICFTQLLAGGMIVFGFAMLRSDRFP